MVNIYRNVYRTLYRTIVETLRAKYILSLAQKLAFQKYLYTKKSSIKLKELANNTVCNLVKMRVEKK